MRLAPAIDFAGERRAILSDRRGYAESLRRAVASGDVAALTVVPGVGKKVAQRVVLDLKDRLGGADVLAEVVCENDEHLLEVINRRIRAIPGVRETETFVYLKLQKQIYTWGTR